jgi:hypothetical protein
VLGHSYFNKYCSPPVTVHSVVLAHCREFATKCALMVGLLCHKLHFDIVSLNRHFQFACHKRRYNGAVLWIRLENSMSVYVTAFMV